MNVAPDQIPRLKQLWAAGIPAVECGAEVGLVGEPHEIREAVMRAIEQPANDETGWTVDRIERLKELTGAGRSAADVARELDDVSRSAVLGKIRRLGLATPMGQPRSNLPARLRTKARDDGDDFFASDGVVDSDAPEDRNIPVEQRRSLLGPPYSTYPEIEPNRCHWGVGEPRSPEFFYCGAAAHGEEAYCAHHCRRAYGYRMRRKAA